MVCLVNFRRYRLISFLIFFLLILNSLVWGSYGSPVFVQPLEVPQEWSRIKLFQAWEGFNQKPTETLPFVEYLDTFTQEYLQINLRDSKWSHQYPNLVRLMRLRDYEANMDKDQLKRESDQLKTLLVETQAEPEVIRFAEVLERGEMVKEILSSKDFNARDLLKRARDPLKQVHFRFQDYPDLVRYVKNVLFRYRLDLNRLREEIQLLIRQILRVITSNTYGREDWEQMLGSKAGGTGILPVDLAIQIVLLPFHLLGSSDQTEDSK